MTDKEKIDYINNNSSFNILTPEQALKLVKKEWANINEYNTCADLSSVLELTDKIKEMYNSDTALGICYEDFDYNFGIIDKESLEYLYNQVRKEN